MIKNVKKFLYKIFFYRIWEKGYKSGINAVCDDICDIIFEGEPTRIGNKITIDRIKDRVNYMKWIDKG